MHICNRQLQFRQAEIFSSTPCRFLESIRSIWVDKPVLMASGDDVEIVRDNLHDELDEMRDASDELLAFEQ